MTRSTKIPKTDQIKEAVDDIGGELLNGSGFEEEQPEEGFTGAALLPSTYLPGKPTESH